MVMNSYTHNYAKHSFYCVSEYHITDIVKVQPSISVKLRTKVNPGLHFYEILLTDSFETVRNSHMRSFRCHAWGAIC